MPSLKNKRKPGLRGKSKKTSLRNTKKSMKKKSIRPGRRIQNGGSIKIKITKISVEPLEVGIDELIDCVDRNYSPKVDEPSYTDKERKEIHNLLMVMQKKGFLLNKRIIDDKLTAEIDGRKIKISRKKENPSSGQSPTKEICAINFVNNFVNNKEGKITLYNFSHKYIEEKPVIVKIHYTKT